MKLIEGLGLWILLIAATGAGCGDGARREWAKGPNVPGVQTFAVTGVVEQVRPEEKIIVIQHEAIANFMPAMTMPFKVKSTNEMSGLLPGDQVSFRLFSSQKESWIDELRTLSRGAYTNSEPGKPAFPEFTLETIPDFAFTNELGQPVSLRSFKGKALAFTFFFTRCPIPEFCPRLTKNFQEASQKLAEMSNGPTNWHLLSISFDPADTPAVLKACAQRYRYDPAHWSFLTGAAGQIQEMASGFGLTISSNAGTFNHNFQTVVFDARGRLQAQWPVGGNTSDALVEELRKAAAAE